MVPLIGALVLLLLAAAPTASANSNSFATLILTDYPTSDGGPVNLTARLTFRTGGGVESAERFLVQFHTTSDEARIVLETAERPDGSPVPIERRENKEGSKESRLWLKAAGDPELVFRGAAAAEANGRHHIGILVIPFDVKWNRVHNANGTALQIYEYTSLGGVGVPDSPVLVGAGNVPYPGMAALVAAVAVAAWLRRGNS